MPKVKLLPVREDCWETVMAFCKAHKTTPMKVIQALMSKSELGQFTRIIIVRRYGEMKKK